MTTKINVSFSSIMFRGIIYIVLKAGLTFLSLIYPYLDKVFFNREVTLTKIVTRVFDVDWYQLLFH